MLESKRSKTNSVAHLTQFMICQKDQHSSRYGFPKFVVLMIDLVLRVSVYACRFRMASLCEAVGFCLVSMVWYVLCVFGVYVGFV